MLLLKQLSKELFKNRVFTVLLGVLSAFTSFLFFFVRFSIDGNLRVLRCASVLSEQEQQYLNALNANKMLAANMLLILTALTAFVFGMFFYRFLKGGARQIGCLRALGFRHRAFYGCFGGFTVLVALPGAAVGLGLGFLCSDVLLRANSASYSVTGLVKSVSFSSVMIGILIPILAYCLVSVGCYALIRKKEIQVLISGATSHKLTAFTGFANRLVNYIPVRNKASLRIALRKPIALFLMVTAVMGFTVMFVLGYSLTMSSKKVYESQTDGHFYRYEIIYDDVQDTGYGTVQDRLSDTLPETVPNAIPDTKQLVEQPKEQAIYYLHANAIIDIADHEISQMLVGLESNEMVYALKNAEGMILETPPAGTIYINPALKEMYGIKLGDTIKLTVQNREYSVTVSDLAVNAMTNRIFCSKEDLAEMLKLPATAFTGVLNMELMKGSGSMTTYEQKLASLERAAVSGKNSALINQSIGCISGCILLFLALLLSFQDNALDMLILHSVGYRPKEIRKLFIDIYLPIVWCTYVVMLLPGIWTAYSVQQSLSLQMKDYMPFQVNWLTIVFILLLLNVVYFAVQSLFGAAIRRMIKKESILGYVNVE